MARKLVGDLSIVTLVRCQCVFHMTGESIRLFVERVRLNDEKSGCL